MLSKSLIGRSVTEDASSIPPMLRMHSKSYFVYMIQYNCPQNTIDLCVIPSKKVVEMESWGLCIDSLKNALYKLLRDNKLIYVNNSNNHSRWVPAGLLLL